MEQKLVWPGGLDAEVGTIVARVLNLSEDEIDSICSISVAYEEGIGEKSEGFDLEQYDTRFKQKIELLKKTNPRIGYAYEVFQTGTNLAASPVEVFNETLTAVAEFFKKTR